MPRAKSQEQEFIQIYTQKYMVVISHTPCAPSALQTHFLFFLPFIFYWPCRGLRFHISRFVHYSHHLLSHVLPMFSSFIFLFYFSLGHFVNSNIGVEMVYINNNNIEWICILKMCKTVRYPVLKLIIFVLFRVFHQPIFYLIFLLQNVFDRITL